MLRGGTKFITDLLAHPMNTPENWETAVELWWQSLSFEDLKAFLYSFLDLIGTDRNLVNALFLLIAIFGFLILALNLFIINVRLRKNHYEKRKIRKADEWSAQLFRIMDGDKRILKFVRSIRRRDRELFTEFLFTYIESLKGKEVKTLINIYEKTGLPKRELYLLDHAFFKQRRALAAYRLGLVRTVAARAKLLKAVQDKNLMLVYCAAGALMNIGNTSDIQKALVLLMKNPQLSEDLFAEILLGYGKEITYEMLKLLRIYKTLPRLRLRMVDFLGHFQTLDAAPYLIKYFQTSKNTEERLRLIKALGNLTTKNVISILLKSLKDPNPLIRSQAAKGLGNFNNEKAIAPLSALLEDSNWWCRTHAAYAIFKTGPVGIEFLENRLETTRNLSTKNMIHQVLND